MRVETRKCVSFLIHFLMDKKYWNSIKSTTNDPFFNNLLTLNHKLFLKQIRNFYISINLILIVNTFIIWSFWVFLWIKTWNGYTRVFRVDVVTQRWKTNSTGLFGGSFAVWPTGNSIDFKICLREKACGQKGGESERGSEHRVAGKERKLSEGDDRCTVTRGGRWRARAASKMRGPFFRHEPVVSDDNNENATQWRSPWPLCESFHVCEIVSFLCSARFPSILSVYEK